MEFLFKLFSSIPLPISDEAKVFIFGTFIISVFAFWLGVAGFKLIEQMGIFKKYKIWPDRKPKKGLHLKAVKLILLNEIFIQFPSIIVTFFMFSFLGMHFYPGNYPGIPLFIFQIIFFMLIEDTMFYWIHRLLHHKKLFRKIHHIHHRFNINSAVASQYAHPVEFLICDLVPVITGPTILLMLGMPVHLLTVWIWLIIRIWESVDAHSGYNLPFWFPHKLIYGGGSLPHDLHHSKNSGSFATFFEHWDKLFKTNVD
jgi:sterol desaturase/sphingolipid hydroxylase (fatty acid hydroxylase superfamily)